MTLMMIRIKLGNKEVSGKRSIDTCPFPLHYTSKEKKFYLGVINTKILRYINIANIDLLLLI